MSKVGLSIKINMDKIDKKKLFKGKKGTYLDLTAFVDADELNGMVKQKADKGTEMPILGDINCFWRER